MNVRKNALRNVRLAVRRTTTLLFLHQMVSKIERKTRVRIVMVVIERYSRKIIFSHFAARRVVCDANGFHAVVEKSEDSGVIQ